MLYGASIQMPMTIVAHSAVSGLSRYGAGPRPRKPRTLLMRPSEVG